MVQAALKRVTRSKMMSSLRLTSYAARKEREFVRTTAGLRPCSWESWHSITPGPTTSRIPPGLPATASLESQNGSLYTVLQALGTCVYAESEFENLKAPLSRLLMCTLDTYVGEVSGITIDLIVGSRALAWSMTIIFLWQTSTLHRDATAHRKLSMAPDSTIHIVRHASTI